MKVTICTKKNDNKGLTYYYLETGKGKGQRWALGLFTFNDPKDRAEKQHNKTALADVQNERAKVLLQGARFTQADFMRFYESFVLDNSRPNSRHLAGSLNHFKSFLAGKNGNNLDEEMVKKFRGYLLENFNGRTPKDYFDEFKRAVKAATKAGCFTINPADGISSKTNPMKKRDFLLAEEYMKLAAQPCANAEVGRAFIFSLYTGLAFCDVQALKHHDIRDGYIYTFRKKTKVEIRVPLHESIAALISPGKGPVFNLPTANGCNKILKQWVNDAGIQKHITWHCARHSLSINLLRESTPLLTVSRLLGHASIRHVQDTYQQYVEADGINAIKKLPVLI